MAPPSSLPSARRVAELCYDEYRLAVVLDLDPALRADLQGIAEYFLALNTLQTVFIEAIVPWSKFIRPPNPGHKAIADFLISRVVEASISTNYDTLIERCGVDYGFDFQSALDGDEAIRLANRQGPLLKLHGCSNRDRLTTLWTPQQISKPPISDRLQKSENWMSTNLRQKDLLIVGFWSDWHYLNEIFSSTLSTLMPSSVTVIDQLDRQKLQQKEPYLWDAMNGYGISFQRRPLRTCRRFHSARACRQMVRHGWSKKGVGYLMDILHQVEIVLRDAGYTTQRARQGTRFVICFENAMLIGFTHVFESSAKLLTQWEAVQRAVLKQYNVALRNAGDKAWNVYSIFLTDDAESSRQRAIERLEENFALTRKIARGGIRTNKDIEHVLLPLTSIQARPSLGVTDFEDRLRVRLKEASSDAVTAFLSETAANEVAHILEVSP